MQSHVVRLTSEVPLTFRTQKAADSVNLNIKEKSVHELKVLADFESPFSVGVIVGSSGSGKTTLAKQLFGIEDYKLDLTRPIIEQFPHDMPYDECVDALTGVGLSSIPCWIRPAYTLSNGQRARAEAALRIATAKPGETIVFDEWTSTVDRTVAQIMSHRLQKAVREKGLRVVVCACHHDVVPWLNADWVVDCNTAEFSKKKAHDQPLNLPSGSATENPGRILASITI
jgi:ABC-type glutathione transport system ATPase component